MFFCFYNRLDAMAKSKISRFFLAVLLLSFALSLLASCGGTPGTVGRDGVMDSVESEEELTGTYPIPPINELTERLSAAGVGYVIDVGNKSEHVGAYVTSPSRAINLGVYGADLTYASTYGVKGDVLRYLNVVLELSRTMNINPTLLEGLASRGEEALEDKDSVQKVASQSIFEVYAAFCANGQQEEAVLFLAGGWLEAVYIGSFIAILSQSNEEVVELLLQQRSTYGTILSLLEKHKKTPEGEHVEELFRSLAPVYKALAADRTSEEAMLGMIIAFEKVRNEIVEVPTN